MSDGTSFTNSEKELDLIKGNQETEHLQATKIGELTEFEKSLMNDDLIENKKVSSKNDENVKEPVTKSIEKDVVDNPIQNILEQELESTVFEFDEGDIVSGIVRTVERSGVIVDFNYKSDGYIANGEVGLDEETEKLVVEIIEEYKKGNK